MTIDSPTLEHMFQHSAAYKKLKETFAVEYEPPLPHPNTTANHSTAAAGAHENSHSEPQVSSSDGFTHSAASHALFSVSPKLRSSNKEASLIQTALSAMTNDLYWVLKTDKTILWLRIKSIFLKSLFVLIYDYNLMILGLLFHVLLALNFYLFLEDASELGSPVMAFFSISASILLISNVIWAFYLFKYNEVQ